VGDIGETRWKKEITEPFLAQQETSVEKLIILLKEILIRHEKKDLILYDPIRSRMDLDTMNEKVEENFYTFLGTAHARYEIEGERSRNENMLYRGSKEFVSVFVSEEVCV
jgi:hypothetical protein